jgi:hypothetical protein
MSDIADIKIDVDAHLWMYINNNKYGKKINHMTEYTTVHFFLGLLAQMRTEMINKKFKISSAYIKRS